MANISFSQMGLNKFFPSRFCEHPFVCKVYGVGGLSLKEYSKGLAGFSSLVEKGFPGYFLCTCAWYFFL